MSGAKKFIAKNKIAKALPAFETIVNASLTIVLQTHSTSRVWDQRVRGVFCVQSS
jgi:hypothetical protein